MRRRPLAPPPPVLDEPGSVGRPRRLAYSLFTLVAWALWAYLWLPLVSLLAWLFGIQLFRQEMLIPARRGYLVSLGWFFLVVAILGLVYAGWAVYNLKRFRGKDRRRHAPSLTTREVAAFYRISPATVESLRAGRRQVLHLDSDGLLEAVDVLDRRPAKRPGQKDDEHLPT